MFNTIGWFIQKGFEAACLLAGIWLFCYIARHGTGAIKELFRTIGVTVKALCGWVQRKISEKEPDEEEGEKPNIDLHITYEEFQKIMKDKSL